MDPLLQVTATPFSAFLSFWFSFLGDATFLFSLPPALLGLWVFLTPSVFLGMPPTQRCPCFPVFKLALQAVGVSCMVAPGGSATAMFDRRPKKKTLRTSAEFAVV